MAAAPAAAPPVARARARWWLVAAGAAGAAAVTAGLLAGGWLPRLDARVAGAVGAADLRSSAAGPLLRLAAEAGGRAVLVAVLLATAGWAGWGHRTLRPLVQALLALAALTAVVYAVKLGAGRPAPGAAGATAAPGLSGGGTSFPSGHVANAVVVWALVREQAVVYRLPAGVRRAAGVLAVAGPVLAGAAVLVLGFHWLSDVVAGAAVGVSLLGVVHALDGVVLSLWVRARAGRRSA